MTLWETRVNEHPATSALHESAELVPGVVLVMRDHEDGAALEYAEAIETIVAHTVAALDFADPRLLTAGLLNQLESPATQVRDQLRDLLDWVAEEETPDPGQQLGDIRAAHGSAEALLATGILNVPRPTDADNVTRNAARRFRDRLASASRDLNATAAEVNSRVDEVGSSFASRQEDIEARLVRSSEDLAQASQDIAQRFTDAQRQIDAAKRDFDVQAEAIDERFAGMDGRFDAEQQARNTRFDENERERREEFTGALRELQEEWEGKLSARDSAAADIEGRLRGLEQEAGRVLGVSAASATYEAAATEAERQRRTADLWRRVAIIALFAAAAVGFVLLVLWGTQGGETLESALVLFLPRIGVTGAIVAGAVYAGREAGRHRAREQAARQAAIDLSSFRPFLAELPTSERNEEIRQAARRQFFQQQSESASEPRPPNGLLD